MDLVLNTTQTYIVCGFSLLVVVFGAGFLNYND